MIKDILKAIIPTSLFNFLKKERSVYKRNKLFESTYKYDRERYVRHCDSTDEKSEKNLIGLIVRRYHVIEKGLTMPETRLGFGKQMLKELISDCEQYVERFGNNEEQLLQAFAVIDEYYTIHKKKNFAFDADLLHDIEKLKRFKSNQENIMVSQQKEYTIDSYFRNTNASFEDFAKSRSSIRNYSEQEVPINTLLNALEIAKTAPSACNRQSWRTYIFSDHARIKEILEVQGGNRGFGHLANKLIIITSETGVFCGELERNQPFIDGGIYAMNLLYSLHYNDIGCCILNCSNTIEKDKKLRNLCKIQDSEVFIAMISVGIPPKDFKAAASIRYPIEKTNTIV